MSLLNDMLRDVSQRQPVLDGAEVYDEQLLQASSIAPNKEHPWVKLGIFFAFIFVAVLGISYVSKKLSKAPATVAVESEKISVVNKKSEIAFAAENTPKPAIAEAEQRPTEMASLELQNHINDLLQQAERAMGMDRLTTPVEDNAYGYYQKILAMSTTNNEAKEGLDGIAQRYLAKAQEQAQLGNLSQAEALLQRARFVSSRYVDAHNIELGDVANHSLTESNFQLGAESQVAQKPAKLSTDSIKPFEVTEASSVSVSTNAGWKDEQLARHAQDLIQKGKQAEAQVLLKNFVASEQKPALSAALLAELYIQQANAVAADIVVEQTNYLAVDVKAKLKAQILSLRGDDAQAITLLEKNLSTAEANEGYRSLLASLYHKTANYPQSVLSYQRLMNSFGEKPAYWLGLALAYDGLSQPKSALQAYSRLQEFPQLQAQVKQYTDQRIAALRSE